MDFSDEFCRFVQTHVPTVARDAHLPRVHRASFPLNNVLLFVDLPVFTQVDLRPYRRTAALAAIVAKNRPSSPSS